MHFTKNQLWSEKKQQKMNENENKETGDSLDRGVVNLALLEASLQCPKKENCDHQCLFRSSWSLPMIKKISRIEEFSGGEAERMYKLYLERCLS